MWLIVLIIADLIADSVSVPGALYFGLVLVAMLEPNSG